jgi:hypothetical protein
MGSSLRHSRIKALLDSSETGARWARHPAGDGAGLLPHSWNRRLHLAFSRLQLILLPRMRKPKRPGAWELAVIACIVLGSVAECAPLDISFVLGSGSDSLTLSADGALLSWEGRIGSNGTASSRCAGEIRYAGHSLQLTEPRTVSRERDGLSFTYAWPEEPALDVTIQHHLTCRDRLWSWTRDVQINGPPALASDLTVFIDSGLASLPPQTWLPLINGVGASLGTNEAAAYHLAGALPNPGASLAMPMVSVPLSADAKKPRRLMIAADPYFSVLFTSNALAWTYPAEGGLENGSEKRTIVVSSHEGPVDRSLDRFFRNVLPDVPPGPKWLHDIAMVDYDYMSDGGQGWFRDIDALAAVVPKADRHKVLLCLHGWYDFLGRYCFDPKTGKFDREWTVFSSYEAAQKAPVWGTIGGDRVSVGFANCKPLKMSLKEVHQRLKYARSRGFRVGMYYADGMNAGDGLPDYDSKCVLEWGGWPGADVKGKSYVQNPLQSKVRAFYLGYARAQLDEFGPDLDMINWDETFHIPVGKLGNKEAPGYADRAMMHLAHDVTLLAEDYNRAHGTQIAFLTSDCLGSVYGPKVKAPYALVAHGTYQDSWCQPCAWSYGIFPNYRNVLWSVCWWPVTKWDWIDFGVRNYQAAVSLSNGWGDDTGFSEMTPAQRTRVLELFNWRKGRPTRLKWFAELPPEPENPNGGK